MKDKKPIIYVLLADSVNHSWLVKIGHTINLKSRIRNIQSGCPYKITPYSSFHANKPREEESFLHKKLCKYNLSGEWFNLPDSEIDWVLDYFRKKEAIYREDISNALL